VLALGATIGFGLGSWSAVRHQEPSPLLLTGSQAATTRNAFGFLPRPENDKLATNPEYVDSASEQSSAQEYHRSKPKVPATLCGAITKKGTPCRRRVRGGGRCYQHRSK
jgi:hypothetical protein